MRIALVTHYFPAHRGGIELVAAQIAMRLAADHGAEIAWYASDCDPPPSIPGVRCFPASSCNAIERHAGFPYPLWSLRALWRTMRAARDAEVLHLHDCLYLPNLAAYLAARLAGKPVLVTQHVGMIPFRNPLLRGVLYAAYRVLGRVVLGGATQVVFVSDAVRRHFSEYVRFTAAPELVFNGVDTAIFHPLEEKARRALRASLGIPTGIPLLLFVGRFVQKKGMPVLRDLAARIPEAHWLFAGWGALDPDQWGLGNVSVARGRAGAQLAPLYQAADLLVLPSRGEGLPLVIQEAMACGTPALVGVDTAAACPDAAQVLPSEDTGGPDVPARWERRIRQLIFDPEGVEKRRMAVAAYATAAWSWERCAARYRALVARCIDEPVR